MCPFPSGYLYGGPLYCLTVSPDAISHKRAVWSEEAVDDKWIVREKADDGDPTSHENAESALKAAIPTQRGAFKTFSGLKS